MNFIDALRNIKPEKKSILFLGAGFSNASTNRKGVFTPSGSQLSERILEKIKIPGAAPLGLAIDKLREKLPAKDAFEYLCDELLVEKLDAKQTSLLGLPWTRIYTTNVDDIGTTYTQRCCHDATEKHPQLKYGDFVYLHGCITNCNLNNFGQKLKLGEQMYMANALSFSGYNHDLRKDLFSADVVFVVGYSMADPNYQEIFYNSEDLISKCFVVSGIPDELSTYRIGLIGVNTEKTLSDMMDDLEKLPSLASVTPERAELTNISTSFTVKDVSQRSRQELLIYGRYDDNVARTSWAAGEQAYAISRDIARQLLTLRIPSIAVVHSNLGNGKSVLFSYAKYLASKMGTQAYTLRPETSGSDLTSVLNDVPIGSLVFFEGDVFAVSKAVDTVIERRLVLCVTSRSTTLRVATPLLIKAAKGRNLLRHFDANTLTAGELADFHDLVDSMAFWPQEMNDMSRARRLEILSGAFSGNINAIILKVFENQKVRSEISKQWIEAQNRLRHVIDHFIVASYMMMIDIAVPSYLLNEFQRIDFQMLKDAESDIIVVEASGKIRFGNSIIAEFVLSHHDNKDEVSQAVVKFCRFISSHVSQSSLQWMVRRLLRYWNLQKLLGSLTAPTRFWIAQVLSRP